MQQPPTQARIRVKEFGFTAYPVKNLTRARSFYEDLLNLTPTIERSTSIEYEINGATLLILNYPGGAPSGDGPCIALEVEDFDEAIQALKNENIPFKLEAFDTPVCRMAVISDPDGNAVTIHKITACTAN